MMYACKEATSCLVYTSADNIFQTSAATIFWTQQFTATIGTHFLAVIVEKLEATVDCPTATVNIF